MVKKRSHVAFFLVILLSTIIILVIIVFTNLGLQPAQVVVPGVTEGDVFTYDVVGLWSSNDPNVTVPETFLQLNMTEWYRVTITEVSGVEVKISTTWRFKNGTELAGTGTVDVETGISYGGFWAIYAADLRANDRVRPNGPDRSTVNETITRGYGASGTRETNRLLITTQYYDADDPTLSTTYTEYAYTYFDRQTGILVELRNLSVYNNPQMTLTILWKIRDTNVWDVT
jgi:hypothetical protein